MPVGFSHWANDMARPEKSIFDDASKAEAIQSYKTLLDSGAITEGEFDKVKRGILGI